MAQFNLPQFIDTEDKVVGPFTAKQIGWMIAAAAVLFVIYSLAGKVAFWFLLLPMLAIFGGLAFYKPYGQPLTFLLSSLFHFFLNPKMYVWKRMPGVRKMAKKVSHIKTEVHREKKNITAEKIEEITNLVDTENKKLF